MSEYKLCMKYKCNRCPANNICTKADKLYKSNVLKWKKLNKSVEPLTYMPFENLKSKLKNKYKG